MTDPLPFALVTLAIAAVMITVVVSSMVRHRHDAPKHHPKPATRRDTDLHVAAAHGYTPAEWARLRNTTRQQLRASVSTAPNRRNAA